MHNLKNSKPRYEIYCSNQFTMASKILRAAYESIAAVDIHNFVATPNTISQVADVPRAKFSLLMGGVLNTHPEFGYMRLLQDYLTRFGHLNFVETSLWLDELLHSNYTPLAKFIEKVVTTSEKFNTKCRVIYPALFIKDHSKFVHILDETGCSHISIYKRGLSQADLKSVLTEIQSVSTIKCTLLGGYQGKPHKELFDMGIYSMIVNGRQYVENSV